MEHYPKTTELTQRRQVESNKRTKKNKGITEVKEQDGRPNPAKLITILNINGLNTSTKKVVFGLNIRKQDSTIWNLL